MKRKEEFIQLLADQIRCKRAREDVIREMEAHISDQAEAYEAEGMEPEEALEFARDSGTLYKAHVMRVLWQYGLADGMYNQVYRSLFGLKPVRGKILHTPKYETVDTVLDLIRACRGVAVLAHPSVYKSMPLAPELIAAGRLDGVEIDHPRNTPEDREELLRLAQQNGLIVTGGTDFHGMNANNPRPVGAFYTADAQLQRIEAAARARKK